MDISRKERGAPHIVLLQQAAGQPFQSKAQSAVRRHSIAMDHKIALKMLWLHPAAEHFFRLLPVTVDALAPGRHLHAAEQQVEA